MSKLQELFAKHSLSNYEQQQLSEYGDDIVLYSLSELDKQTKPITHKLNWLLAVCKNRLLISKNPPPKQPEQHDQLKVAYNKKEIIHAPKPWWQKSYEDNLQMFNDWYINYADECAEYYRKDKTFYANQFMEELNKRFSNIDEVNRINERAKEYGAILNKLVPRPKENNEIDKDIISDIKDLIRVKFEGEQIATI